VRQLVTGEGKGADPNKFQEAWEQRTPGLFDFWGYVLSRVIASSLWWGKDWVERRRSSAEHMRSMLIQPAAESFGFFLPETASNSSNLKPHDTQSRRLFDYLL
jgi:hypothetical protein